MGTNFSQFANFSSLSTFNNVVGNALRSAFGSPTGIAPGGPVGNLSNQLRSDMFRGGFYNSGGLFPAFPTPFTNAWLPPQMQAGYPGGFGGFQQFQQPQQLSQRRLFPVFSWG